MLFLNTRLSGLSSGSLLLLLPILLCTLHYTVNSFPCMPLRQNDNQNQRTRTSVLWQSTARQNEVTEDTTVASLWTEEQLMEYSRRQGVTVSLTTLGPAFRAMARARHNTTLVMGYVEGVIRPGGGTRPLLHLDRMEVFRTAVRRAREENPREFTGGGTTLGVGLLLGYLCMLHGREQGCLDAEFLAIDDEERQHKRLVRYYRQAGFDIVRYVGEDLRSIPDRLVWGGCGTLLRKDVGALLAFWTALLEKSVERQKQRAQQK